LNNTILRNFNKGKRAKDRLRLLVKIIIVGGWKRNIRVTNNSK